MTPTPLPIDLTGAWAGNLSVQDMAARMTWTLTQTGATVTGPVLVALPSGTVLLNGTLSGTLLGSTLTYTITVPAGGIPSQPSCTGQLGGSVNATIGVVSTLAGSYAVTSSTCQTPFSSGNFTLTR